MQCVHAAGACNSGCMQAAGGRACSVQCRVQCSLQCSVQCSVQCSLIPEGVNSSHYCQSGPLGSGLYTGPFLKPGPARTPRPPPRCRSSSDGPRSSAGSAAARTRATPIGTRARGWAGARVRRTRVKTSSSKEARHWGESVRTWLTSSSSAGSRAAWRSRPSITCGLRRAATSSRRAGSH